MRKLWLVGALVLVGCATQEKVDAWTGHHMDTLLKTWGPPSNAANLTDGGATLEYRDVNAVGYPCRVQFSVSPDGIITKGFVGGTLGGCNYLFNTRPEAPPRG